MSYLNVPRLNFSGRFLADLSTINNNDAKEEAPNPPDSTKTSVYWNPNGTIIAPGGDPLIGAVVASSGGYPAKIVDLDLDSQAVSQVFGLQVTISIPTPGSPSQALLGQGLLA